MTRYVGIDLHKHLIVGHIVDPGGKTLDTFRYTRVDAATLDHLGRMRLTREDEVVLEATTHCWAVVRALEPFVARVVVSNPMATKAIAKAKVKTDQVDAAVLAHLLRLGYLPEVWQPDPATRHLREWTARRSRIVGQRTAVINRLRSTLAQRLLHCPYEMTSPAAREWIAGQPVEEDTRWLLESDLRLMDSLQTELDAMEKLLAKRGYVDPRVKLLMTLPGVSQHTAQALLAWHVLTKGEPYRYALPQATNAKLSKLRVLATGRKRPGGGTRGTKCRPKLPGAEGGSRTIKSLAEVYAIEGLPAATAAPPGEQRHLAANRLDTFAAELQQTRVVPRRAPKLPGALPGDL